MMRVPAIFVLAGLLLLVGAAAYAQSNPFGAKFVHRGWLGRPTYTAPVGAHEPEQHNLSGSDDTYGAEQALQPESAYPPTKSDR